MLNLAIAALLVSPSAPASGTMPAPLVATSQAPALGALEDLFPAPSGPLVLELADPENEPSVADLVQEYCELTGQNAISSADTQSLMKQYHLHLVNSLVVPAEEVQHTFELLLRQNDFTMTILKSDGVRLFEINSLATSQRNNLRASARFLEPDQIDVAKRHPALLFTTVVTLPNTDVRQLSNSMRTIITDANTQQMLPAGNSNSMVLVGFGDSVSSLVGSLKIIDAASAIEGMKRKPITELIRLQNATAKTVAALLAAALGGNPELPNANDVKILSDERTNSLIVVANLMRMGEVKDLVASLDAK